MLLFQVWPILSLHLIKVIPFRQTKRSGRQRMAVAKNEAANFNESNGNCLLQKEIWWVETLTEWS
jgi:hypothetical protein